MLISFFKVVYGLICSFLYKVIYLNSSDFCFYKVCFNGSLIILNGGRLIFKGRFMSRGRISVNINGGELICGDNVFFNRGVSLNCRSHISVGNNSMFGEDVKIYDHDHERYQGKILLTSFNCKAVTIGSNVWIGSNVIILKGVNIGDNVVVSAGSIVTKSLPSGSVLIQKRKDTIY